MKPMEDNYAYSLFVLEKDFAAVQIDMSTGKQTTVATQYVSYT